ncbi:hypothetical protein Tco_0785490 [Tanacetum coccineum]
MNLKTEYPAIVFDDISDVAFSREPTVSPLDNNEIDFNISFDEFDDEDYMIVFDENSFSCKIISVDNLKMDLENGNDKINIPSSLSPEPIIDMAQLPHRDLRHPWLRYQVDGYDERIIHSNEQRLETIWGWPVNRVHVLDFTGLKDGMRQTLGDRLSMVYVRDDEKALFTSHAWRRLFEVMVLLVREFILEFLSTYRMSDTKMGLDVADILCFQLSRARRRMTWRQFILALGLHSEEEMAEPRFNICSRFGDTWAWIAPGLETQQAAAVGAPRAVEDALAANEGAQAIPAPVQEPQLPPPPP